MLELVHLARHHPFHFYGFSAHGEQPLSCLFDACLYGLAHRAAAACDTQVTRHTRDAPSFPDVFSVIAALGQGIAAQAQRISPAEAAALRARYTADSLEVAADRELQMLLSRPSARTDASYMGDDFLSKQHDLLTPVPVVDDYTGQNNLHVIIANGTIVGGIAAAQQLFSIVTHEPFRQRLLRARATGRFFCPYYGTVRLGATPLHFAVLTQQMECVRHTLLSIKNCDGLIRYVKLILEELCRSDIERLDVLWDRDNSGNTVCAAVQCMRVA
jgi:hypothetical protein